MKILKDKKLRRADFDNDEEFLHERTLREIQQQLSWGRPEPKTYDPWGSLKNKED